MRGGGAIVKIRCLPKTSCQPHCVTCPMARDDPAGALSGGKTGWFPPTAHSHEALSSPVCESRMQ